MVWCWNVCSGSSLCKPTVLYKETCCVGFVGPLLFVYFTSLFWEVFLVFTLFHSLMCSFYFVRYDLLLNSAMSHLAVNQLLKNQRKDPWVLHLYLCLRQSNWLQVTLSNQRQGCLLCHHRCQFIILFYQRFSQLISQSECQSLDLIHHLRRKRVCFIINIKNRQYDDVDLPEMSV